MRPVRTIYGGQARGSRSEVTKALVAINVAIYLITALNAKSLTSPDPSASIYSKFALEPPQVANGEWYRLISSMFLHYGLFHIAFNMWALWVIGSPLESMLGRMRFLVLYGLSGIGGAVLSFSFGPLDAPAAGASGAIFGLFGAFFVILRRRNLETGGIVGLIGINLVLSFVVSNIDWRGHVGGLIAGGLVGAVFAYAPTDGNRDRLQTLGCAALAVVLAAGGLFGANHVRHECRTANTGQIAAACFSAGIAPGG